MAEAVGYRPHVDVVVTVLEGVAAVSRLSVLAVSAWAALSPAFSWVRSSV